MFPFKNYRILFSAAAIKLLSIVPKDLCILSELKNVRQQYCKKLT